MSISRSEKVKIWSDLREIFWHLFWYGMLSLGVAFFFNISFWGVLLTSFLLRKATRTNNV